ncbi:MULTISPECIES: S1C family serine protease [Bacillus]|uniref:Serine protease Do n=1 Tax=Bacillus capparidis TaxID=1840411 RepID=A0ABS4CY08_9BACI|nr:MULTISPECIES: S1C family serine protease [Bacillus]MBP1082248.1 serine protease Do [Bacillus capparidis]MED1096858.1 S1C family serine protease [Bacillus capparidis]
MDTYNHKYIPEKPRRSRKGYFISSLIGVIIGAILVLMALPFLSSRGLLPYDMQTGTQQVEQDASELPVRSVSVDVNNAVTDVVQRVSDAVVGVVNIQKTNIWDESGGEAGTGSGVIYKKTDGTSYVVTNHHVIEGATNLEISLKNGTRVGAKLIGSDSLTDLAVLKINNSKIKAVADFGDSDKVKPGEPVIAIGNPLGLQFSGSVTQGVISGTERAIPVDSNKDGEPDWNAEVLQTDAAINPGNSGGALININGKVIGINSMKIAESAVEGIGLSIPVNLAIPVIQDLESYGEVRRPFLGIEMKSLTDISSNHWQETLKLPRDVTKGIVVMGVDPNSPAGEAGMKELDVITEFDGKPVNDIIQIRKVLYKKNIGDTAQIRFYRNGSQKSAKVTLTESNAIGR